MPLLLWPFPSGITPPPTPPPAFVRALSGKIVVLDTGHYGGQTAEFQPPKMGESCALVFFVGNGLPMTQQPVLFTFTRPDGTFQLGDPRFAFIGLPGSTFPYFYPFPSGQYLLYLFGIGELGQRGTWKVSAITGFFISGTFNFVVI